MRSAARDVLESVGVRMPHVTAATSAFPVRDAFSLAVHEGHLLPSGYTAFRFQMVNVTYTALWANPLWEWTGVAPESEAAQIEETLRTLLASLPGRQPLALDDAAMATGSLPILVPARVKRWARWLWLSGQSIAAKLWTPPWEW